MKRIKILAILVSALGLTAEVAKADFTFGTPTNLGPMINSPYTDFSPSIAADGLSLYFVSTRPGGYGTYDLCMATRSTKSDVWSAPINLGPVVNSSSEEWFPSISAGGLSLFFSSNRPGGYGDHDLWVTTRATTNDDWGSPVNLGPRVNNSAVDAWPSISSDSLSLYFASGPRGSYSIYVTKRSHEGAEWGTPVKLGSPVNIEGVHAGPCISADGLSLFFHSSRAGGFGIPDLYMVTRKAIDDKWFSAINLGENVNTSYPDLCPNISADGLSLYFCDFPSSPRPGGFGGGDLWQVSIIPIVDLNGDGIVDAQDMCIVVDHWGTDESLCDIGPMPWGDDIVDVQDLIVLAEHLFEEVKDPTLIAHWALDEIEGDIASDSANDNDGTVYGDPAWLPEGGMVDGALQLDGIDDYVSTPFLLNPADGKFSVFVWIKGGAPGQAVLSQMGGVNWLCADTFEGNLITELKATGRGAAALLSETVITDGNWHRIGVVWDGSYRTLYVDDVVVAEDTQTNLQGSDNSFYIGTGKAMEAGTYWSGLVDDVRIYNRAVIP